MGGKWGNGEGWGDEIVEVEEGRSGGDVRGGEGGGTIRERGVKGGSRGEEGYIPLHEE